VGDGEWALIKVDRATPQSKLISIEPTSSGSVFALDPLNYEVTEVFTPQAAKGVRTSWKKSRILDFQVATNDSLLGLIVAGEGRQHILSSPPGRHISLGFRPKTSSFIVRHDGLILATGTLPDESDAFAATREQTVVFPLQPDGSLIGGTHIHTDASSISTLCFSPDQSMVYATQPGSSLIISMRVVSVSVPKRNLLNPMSDREDDPFSEKQDQITAFALRDTQSFVTLQPAGDGTCNATGMCVDTNGWLYVATALGIQVCDQAGRVNFIIPTPKQPYDVCFGGKDLSELFIACGDTIYKRPTKARGIVSGQQAPIKPAPPKL
jgi:hypothetical protein